MGNEAVGNLSDEDKAFLDEQAAAVRELGRRTAQAMLEMGRRLRMVRERVPRGTFTEWVVAQCGLTERTAQHMMLAAEHYGEIGENFSGPATVLYRLAAPSTPEAVREQFRPAIETGQPVRLRDIDAAIRDARDASGSFAATAAQPDPAPPLTSEWLYEAVSAFGWFVLNDAGYVTPQEAARMSSPVDIGDLPNINADSLSFEEFGKLEDADHIMFVTTHLVDWLKDYRAELGRITGLPDSLW